MWTSLVRNKIPLNGAIAHAVFCVQKYVSPTAHQKSMKTPTCNLRFWARLSERHTLAHMRARQGIIAIATFRRSMSCLGLQAALDSCNLWLVDDLSRFLWFWVEATGWNFEELWFREVRIQERMWNRGPGWMRLFFSSMIASCWQCDTCWSGWCIPEAFESQIPPGRCGAWFWSNAGFGSAEKSSGIERVFSWLGGGGTLMAFGGGGGAW